MTLRRYAGRGVEKRCVTIPRCRGCAALVHWTKALFWSLALLASVGLIASVYASAAITDESRRGLIVIVGILAPFVLLPLVAFMVSRLVRRAGIVNQSRLKYPGVLELRAAGWKRSLLPRWAVPLVRRVGTGLDTVLGWADEGATTHKSCSNCHRQVSDGSHVGQRCPYCGVVWGGERRLDGPPPY